MLSILVLIMLTSMSLIYDQKCKYQPAVTRFVMQRRYAEEQARTACSSSGLRAECQLPHAV